MSLEAAPRRTRVAVYYPWVYLTSGAERTILELVRRSRHDWTILTNHFDPEHTFPGLRACRVVELGRVSVRRSVRHVGGAAWRIAAQRLPLEGYDALVVVGEGLGDLALARNASLPALCVCLTPLRIAFDPAYRARHAEGRRGWERVAVAAGAAAFRAVDRRLWRRYARVVCISEEARRRAQAGRLVPAGPLEVLAPGIGFEPDAAASEFGDFFLVPGRIMWTKNLELAVAAFRRFRAEHPAGGRFRLVVAGIVDAKSGAYLERLRAAAGDDGAVEFRVFPSDAELAALYRTCYAVLFPAFNEDWGMVPLEAMAFGKPVLATDRGGPRETVLPGVTGFLEEPTVEAFAARLGELAGDPGLARALGARGPERARLFSWDRFVSHVDEAIAGLTAARAASAPAPLAARPAAVAAEGGAP